MAGWPGLGHPGLVSPERPSRTFNPYQGRPFSRDLTGRRRAAGMHIRMPSRDRSNRLASHGGLRGAGKNIRKRKWNSFLRWGSAPNPVVVSIRRRRQCLRLVVLVVGFWLVGLV